MRLTFNKQEDHKAAPPGPGLVYPLHNAYACLFKPIMVRIRDRSAPIPNDFVRLVILCR